MKWLKKLIGKIKIKCSGALCKSKCSTECESEPAPRPSTLIETANLHC